VADCEAAGYKIAVPTTELRPGITIAIIEDPDGNWVELLTT
jgi:catechol 2,3-dioxygenase-like lactoylglutathione lyase family enzyme